MHTKGKWTTRELKNEVYEIHGEMTLIAAVGEATTNPTSEANAKRIVQAVNSHDDLLEVSKMIVEENLANYEALGELAFAIDYIANKAKQAIAQAEMKC